MRVEIKIDPDMAEPIAVVYAVDVEFASTRRGQWLGAMHHVPKSFCEDGLRVALTTIRP